jgi:hypothetical protein
MTKAKPVKQTKKLAAAKPLSKTQNLKYVSPLKANLIRP